MKQKLKSLLLGFSIMLLANSCLDQLGAQLPPLNTRKLKKKLGPTYAFNNLVLDYRSENGFWPKSKLDLVRAGKNTIDQLEGMGFTDWYLGQDSQDSLYIHFVHIPVFENAHIGGVPIPGRQVKLKTLYTFPKRYIQTSLEK